MASELKAPEVMEWQQGEEAGQDELSQDTACSVGTDSTRLARSHSHIPAPQSPSLSIGFLFKPRHQQK